jgi:hypothetical protein
MQLSTIYIVSCEVFGVTNRFIGHSQVVTTINYTTLEDYCNYNT